MIRAVAGVCAGLIVWFVLPPIINVLLRVSWPGYAEAEMSVAFPLGMLLARLVLGMLSSICAGFVLAWITKAYGIAATVLGFVLIVIFIPVHYGLWDKFPVWYHLIFLASLIPLTLLGARLKAQPISTEPRAE